MFVSQRQERLLEVLQRAHDSSLLKENFYKNWVRPLNVHSLMLICILLASQFTNYALKANHFNVGQS